MYVLERAYISRDLSRGCEVESETRVVVSHAEPSCDEPLKSYPFFFLTLAELRSLPLQIIVIVGLALVKYLGNEI